MTMALAGLALQMGRTAFYVYVVVAPYVLTVILLGWSLGIMN